MSISELDLEMEVMCDKADSPLQAESLGIAFAVCQVTV